MIYFKDKYNTDISINVLFNKSYIRVISLVIYGSTKEVKFINTCS